MQRQTELTGKTIDLMSGSERLERYYRLGKSERSERLKMTAGIQAAVFEESLFHVLVRSGRSHRTFLFVPPEVFLGYNLGEKNPSEHQKANFLFCMSLIPVSCL